MSRTELEWLQNIRKSFHYAMKHFIVASGNHRIHALDLTIEYTDPSVIWQASGV